MIARLAIVAAVLALVVAAPASARTVLVGEGPSVQTFQGWIDESRVATASVRIPIELRRCDEWQSLACVKHNARGGPTRLVVPDWQPEFQSRLTLLHEVGHVYDGALPRRWYRQKFMRIMRYRPARGFLNWSTAKRHGRLVVPFEQFADAYSACAVSDHYDPVIMAEVATHYGYRVTPATYERVCYLMRQLPAQAVVA